MFEMDLGNLIAGIKEQLIPHGKSSPQALYMCFEVGLEVYEGESDIRRYTNLHVMLYCPHGGSVHTFVAESQNRFGKFEGLEWRNTSNHDSCWRSDGINRPISDVYFRMAEEINAGLVANGEEEVAPVKMSMRCDFASWSYQMWRMVDVEVVKRKDDYHRYDLKILDAKKAV